jgi:RNA-directed DNA polymerase
LKQAKSFDISKQVVWEAYQRLYKLWNRMASGSYFPPPVQRVEIPKKDGGLRPLGIPTVSDRIAQMVRKQLVKNPQRRWKMYFEILWRVTYLYTE